MKKRLNSCDRLSPETIKEFNLTKNYLGYDVNNQEIEDHIETNIFNIKTYNQMLLQQQKYRISNHNKSSRENLEKISLLNEMKNEERMNNVLKNN